MLCMRRSWWLTGAPMLTGLAVALVVTPVRAGAQRGVDRACGPQRQRCGQFRRPALAIRDSAAPADTSAGPADTTRGPLRPSPPPQAEPEARRSSAVPPQGTTGQAGPA